jgi:hypothetical protein
MVNCGFVDLDRTPPSTTGMAVVSTSHIIGVPSPDATIDLEIAPPADDFSGTNGYSIAVARNGPVAPDLVAELENPSAFVPYTTQTLSPGVFYVSVRPRDFAGNWSSSYVVAGPYEVRAPIPTDIAFGRGFGAGIAGPLVLRTDDTAGGGIVQWSDPLLGDQNVLHWNVVTSNIGDEAPEIFVVNNLFVDGEFHPDAPTDVIAPPAGMSTTISTNLGPFSIPPGRHTVSVRYEAAEGLPEPDETNNSAAVSLVFQPSPMTPGTPVVRDAPPDRTGGFSDFEASPGPVPGNKDGVRFESGPIADAVVVWSDGPEADYPLRLYAPTTSRISGFGFLSTAFAVSDRGKGRLSAVLANVQAGLPHTLWDVGIVNQNLAEDPYTALHVRSEPLELDVPVEITLDASAPLALRSLLLDLTSTGWQEIVLDVGSDGPVVRAAWYPSTLGTFGLEDASAEVVTDASGQASLEFEATSVGHHVFSIWLDPVDRAPGAPRRAQINVTTEVRPSRPDFAFLGTPDGWVGPIVPAAGPTGTPTSVGEPTTLTGDSPATYLNVHLTNRGNVLAGPFSVRVDIDGNPLESFAFSGAIARSEVVRNSGDPVTVRPGRHTLSVLADAFDEVGETSESNNRVAEQFAWVPVGDLPNSASLRTEPAGIVDGWDGILSTRFPLRYNCDGSTLRWPGTEWWGVAIQPDAASDVDLRLFELDSDARSGFSDPLGISGWGPGEVDFILIDGAGTAPRDLHVGALGTIGSGSPYLIQAIEGTAIEFAGAGALGPFSLAADEVVDLFSVSLTPGLHRLRLTDLDGVDLQFSVHGDDIPFSPRSRPLEDGGSSPEDGTAVDQAVFRVDQAREFAIAVFRRDPVSTTAPTPLAPATYLLELDESTAVDDDAVASSARIRTGPPRPNPFNPRTTIWFELPRRNHTRVTVYDLNGRRIRRLVDEPLAAGRHEVTWQGLDDQGRIVASGVYVYRIRSGEDEAVGRCTLLK